MFVVNSALDTPNPNSLNLREAIAASNAQPPGLQMIVFAPNMEGQTITLASQLTIENHIYIAGPGSQLLTVTRDATQGDFRLFEVKAGWESVIAGMTLTGGKAPTNSAGGAILNGGVLTVTGCVIDDNSAKYGGGIASTAQTFSVGLPQKGLLNVYDSTITNNTASSRGGGIYVVDSDLTISNDVCIMQNGAFLDGGGLAILLTDTLHEDLTINLIDVNISANTAGMSGGGIWTSHYKEDDTALFKIELNFNGGIVCSNTASFLNGGGIYLSPNTVLKATNSPTFAGNESPNGLGDGLYISEWALRVGTIVFIGNSYYDANPA